MVTYLVTGGAGFVGSHVAIGLKRDHGNARVVALDNLRRRGSEFNLPRLRAAGVEFVHGDIRQTDDLACLDRIDVLIECSADASVAAGFTTAPTYVTSTNLVGLLNCLELARRHQATFVFLSTSRVYPIHTLNALSVVETATRFELTDQQSVAGASAAGISEAFPLEGTRSLYGATKLAGELLAQEYFEMYGLAGVINRCGLLTGPWQMGRIDQGVVALWVARHVLKGRLQYFGYGGCGKQVRDILHIEDFYRLLSAQLDRIDGVRGGVFNVGGGPEGTVSLLELTALCEQSTGHRLRIDPVAESSPADIRVYVSDCRKVHRCTGWSPAIRPADIVQDLTAWVVDHRALLEPLFC